MKYFFAKSIAHRLFDGVTFSPAEMHGGALTGIYATEDEAEISKLSVNREVEEITEDMFLKKKASSGLSERQIASLQSSITPVPAKKSGCGGCGN